MTLFIIENLFILWGFQILEGEEREITREKIKMNKCYYDICKEYPEAKLEDNVCFCYDYDNLGSLILVETKVMAS